MIDHHGTLLRQCPHFFYINLRKYWKFDQHWTIIFIDMSADVEKQIYEKGRSKCLNFMNEILEKMKKQ